MTFVSSGRMSAVRRLTTSMLAGIALILSTAANAASVSVFMNLSNNQEVYPDGTNYIEVTISDGNNGDIDFSVATLGPLQNFVPDWNNFGITSFKFNFGSSGATIDNILVPGGQWSVSNQHEGDDEWAEFGLFDAFLSGEYLKTTLNFSIFGVDGDTPEDYLQPLLYRNNYLENKGGPNGVFFVAKVIGLSSNPNFKNVWPMDPSSTMVKFAAPVPLPTAAWLFISAIGVLAWMRYRRNAHVTTRELQRAPG